VLDLWMMPRLKIDASVDAGRRPLDPSDLGTCCLGMTFPTKVEPRAFHYAFNGYHCTHQLTIFLPEDMLSVKVHGKPRG
jgi:hypothetical protein